MPIHANRRALAAASRRLVAAAVPAAAVAVLAATLSLAPAPGAAAVGADSVKNLAGRWSGWGAVTHSSGQSEQVKCVATYFVKDAGEGLEQNLRCASASYKIDASARLTIDGEKVKGSWEERANSTQGEISGRVTGGGFNLNIQGEHFTAAMAVSASACKQSINIAPEGFQISRIAIGLQKC